MFLGSRARPALTYTQEKKKERKIEVAVEQKSGFVAGIIPASSCRVQMSRQAGEHKKLVCLRLL
jgi:hypothetical protein